MHRGHDHDHHGGASFISGRTQHPPAPRLGHNQPVGKAMQWQAPHLKPGEAASADAPREPDLDLVEAAFVQAFTLATDATSFLRLANVPFEAWTADGTRLALLRVEIQAVTDMGSVMPHLGGESFGYDPLPSAMVSRRQKLSFVYFDGKMTVPLDLAAAKALGDANRASPDIKMPLRSGL